MRLIYLAGPYSHDEEKVRRERVDYQAKVMAYFADTTRNLCLYSPIVQWSAVASAHELPHDFNFWMQQDFHMIRLSTAVWVVTMEGWLDSFGLAQELEFAADTGKDVLYVVEDSKGFHLRDAWLT